VFVAAGAGSTLLTVLAAIVAGNGADLELTPAAFSARVILVLAAPCLGALLPGLLVARRGPSSLRWAAALGVPVGPLLALRLDRMQTLGAGAVLATFALLAALVLLTRLLLEAALARPDAAPARRNDDDAESKAGASSADTHAEGPNAGAEDPKGGTRDRKAGRNDLTAGADIDIDATRDGG